MVHYSSWCHLLLLHLMSKAPNWHLEDPKFISILPVGAGIGFQNGTKPHQAEMSQFMKAPAISAVFSPSVILCHVLGSYCLWAGQGNQINEMALGQWRGPHTEGMLRAIAPLLSPSQDFRCAMQLHVVPEEPHLEDKQQICKVQALGWGLGNKDPQGNPIFNGWETLSAGAPAEFVHSAWCTGCLIFTYLILILVLI